MEVLKVIPGTEKKARSRLQYSTSSQKQELPPSNAAHHPNLYRIEAYRE